ncbi:hypothetical protein DEO72_LG10g2725 [Vigna unguiculata]|uniref:Uncharacterized protein n=1 Tax=Vigna unguiculata TaxID=3917 RepID=A0A4D6NEZ8_VIGUN|nr:hypothetical protein DEO72_LG10g2725 [Vigna unguiculata]
MLSTAEVSSPIVWDDLGEEPSMLPTTEVSSPGVWDDLGGEPSMLPTAEVSSPGVCEDLDKEPSVLPTTEVSSPDVWGELGGEPAKPLRRSSMSSSYLSDRSATKIYSDRVGASLAFPSTSSSTTSSDEEGVVGSPSHSGYEWVDKGVREYFSKYQSSSSIRKFAAAYAILDEDSPDEAVSLDQVGSLMASHEGVGACQKSHFQLLREKVNARKRDEDALVGSSSGAAGRNNAGGGTPRPPPAAKKKRKKTSQKGESSSRHSSPKRSRVSEVVAYTRLMGTEM